MSHLVDRLLANYAVDDTTGCWNWVLSLRPNGYGQIANDRKSLYPHRVSYEVHIGPIPAGLAVCHRCDNRACINPDHLFVGTRAENNADRNAKGRQARGVAITKNRRPMHGVRNGRARINESDVIAIRDSKSSLRQLARAYGLGPTQISRIRNGKSWLNVESSTHRVPAITTTEDAHADDRRQQPA